MLIDIIIVLCFFILRLPLYSFIEFIHIDVILYRIVSDSIIVIVILLLSRIQKPLSQSLLGWHAPKKRDFTYGVIGSIILFAISLSIISITPQKQLYDAFFLVHSYKIYILLIISSVTEELFYRGFLLYKIVKSNMNPSYAILISALIFAMGHLYMGTGGFIFSLLAGILLSYAIITFNSLSLVIISHVLYNVLFFMLQRISDI